MTSAASRRVMQAEGDVIRFPAAERDAGHATRTYIHSKGRQRRYRTAPSLMRRPPTGREVLALVHLANPTST
jgi:hypothetical protein